MVPLPAVPTVPAVPAVPAAAESLATPATAMQLEALAKMVRVVGRPVTTEGLTRGQASTLLKELIDEANTRSAQRRGDAVVTPVASPAPPVALAPPAESKPVSPLAPAPDEVGALPATVAQVDRLIRLLGYAPERAQATLRSEAARLLAAHAAQQRRQAGADAV